MALAQGDVDTMMLFKIVKLPDFGIPTMRKFDLNASK
ncbi:hypothetical protein ACVIGA_007603 [Bradyrhizobium sp. USDA 3240]